MKQFNEQEWAELEAHLVKLGNGLTRNIFEEWLSLPETEDALVTKYGEGYSLWQALSHMITPPVRQRSGKKSFDSNPRRRQRGLGGDRSYKADGYEDAGKDAGKDTGRDGDDGGPGGGLSEDEFNARVDKRLDDYLVAYKDVAPNDLASLRDLCFAEVNVELLNMMIAREYSKGKPDGTAINRFLYALKGASEQHRALQKALHIDRATREREAAKASDVDEVLAVIEAAGEFVEDNAIRLIHEGCTVPGAVGKSDIQFGLLVWDFRELPVDVIWKCPRCGQVISVSHRPSAKELEAAAEPVWVAEEESLYKAKEEELKGPGRSPGSGEKRGENEESEDSKDTE